MLQALGNKLKQHLKPRDFRGCRIHANGVYWFGMHPPVPSATHVDIRTACEICGVCVVEDVNRFPGLGLQRGGVKGAALHAPPL